ncbi:MAG: hypothetical protein ACRBBP_08455, partial [Bdellovibrionales bacterium]
MRFLTTLSIGFLFVFLNSSLSFGATTYLFGDEHCSTLTGLKWNSLGKSCPKGQLTHSLKDSLELFCMYTLKPGDNLRSSLEKNRFYRSKERVSVIPYST